MSNILKLRDDISMMDKISMKGNHKKSLWARTQIIGGYGISQHNGISQIDEVVFESENLVPIGGVQYAMEMIFGVKGPLNIPTLNDRDGIGAQGSTIVPGHDMPYPYGQKVVLFGVGCGGATENNLKALDVKYNEYTVSGIYPIRFTNTELTESEKAMYFGKKLISNSSSDPLLANLNGDTMAYYLKRFDVEPTIKHLFKDAPEDIDGTPITDSYFETGSEVDAESFTEIQLTISKRDCREWFDAHGNIEESRINSIGLFTAIYDDEKEDYANIQLFSKLNIPTEPLALTKDMNILYRVYGA